MKASVTNSGAITLTSETAGEIELLKKLADLRLTRWGVSVFGIGSDCDVTLAVMETEQAAKERLEKMSAALREFRDARVGQLTTPVVSTASQALSHLPSQRQAAKVASYYEELRAHHVSPEFAEQLTLEYQRMEMENA